MIDYAQYAKIHHLRHHGNLRIAQIAAEMSLNEKTVSHWLARERFESRKGKGRSSKLDLLKPRIKGWLEKHPYSAQQIFQLLRQDGYTGGYTILKEYVRKVRPRKPDAYLTLSFAPGESAQVDWGSFGVVPVGNTRRQLSFFVMVLSYSRMMYVEFTLSQKQEHFLQCHENAFLHFGGIPRTVMIDNLKTGVLEHKRGEPALVNPRYADYARHCGFEVVACNPREPQEKGRVENGVGYVKKNFLQGLRIDDFAHLAAPAKRWLDEIANVRTHRQTHRKPAELWAKEKPHLQALPLNPCDTGTPLRLRASSTFRLTIDTNRYSVPAEYASQFLELRLHPDKILAYNQGQLVAEHTRSYGRNGDFENPDHPRALLAQRHHARVQKNLQLFLQLGPDSEVFYHQMHNRRLNSNVHVRKILALAETHTREQVADAISDAHRYNAYSSEYIANILEQRGRPKEEAGPLHLTRPSDLLELESPAADLSIYNLEGGHE